MESLILATCLFGTAPACSAAGTAYYKQIGLERLITQKTTDFRAKYPLYSFVIGAAAQAGSGSVVLPLNSKNSLIFRFNNAKVEFRSAF